MVVGHLQGRLVETNSGQPRLVLDRPVRPAPPDPGVAQQELGQQVPGPGQVLDYVPPGPAQVPHRLQRRGNPDSDQLPGPMQTGQTATVPLIGLDLVTRASWGSARGQSPRSAPPSSQAGGPGRSRSAPPRSTPATSGARRTGRSAGGPTPHR